jgi:hypothetical protein
LAARRAITTGDRDHAYDVVAQVLGSRVRSTAALLTVGALSAVIAVAVDEARPELALLVGTLLAGTHLLGDVLLRRPRVRVREELR